MTTVYNVYEKCKMCETAALCKLNLILEKNILVDKESILDCCAHVLLPKIQKYV